MAGNIFHAILLLLLIGWSTGDKKYCSLCTPPNTHTMCIYKKGPAEACVGYEKAALTKDDMDAIVKKHNELRNKVALGNEERGEPGPQPQAANMLQMSWDNELATIAQRWADQCIKFGVPGQHDKCRDVQRYQVGQNVAACTYSPSQAGTNYLEMFMMNWYEEVAKFNNKAVDPFAWTSGVGHYTQQVWAKTHHIGCGRVRFSQDSVIVERLVCNYGPAGNVISMSMYLIGKACSSCPNGTSCSSVYKGLCTDASSTILPNYNTILLLFAVQILRLIWISFIKTI